ncbi:Glutathione S-transferase, N-terminal domain containing protein, putative [Trypanosoma equiperdum]|uniref:Glutathione S-transferase, N-terminal domain containing protein, putative n=1 Tax=Trypanosoma equiperdum TaxID=5694 RepID=A0A1G4I7F1_TRYEQ|nr:Glutathione S-transferase, N-terminal domain containing protein, putative [Trypanosoma equiperdum]
MVLTLVGSLEDHNVHRILLVAAFAQTKVKVAPITDGVENATESYRLNCHPLGRAPVLKSDEGYLFGTNAIIRHFARTERPYGPHGSLRYPTPEHTVPYTLYGKSELEVAAVDQWLAFIMTEVDPHVLQIVEAEKRGSRRQEQAAAQGACDAVLEALGDLEQQLKSKKKQLQGHTCNGSTHLNGSVCVEEADGGLSEEEGHIAFTPRGTTALRGCHTYNIKSCTEERHESSSIMGNSPPDSKEKGNDASSFPWQSLCTVNVMSPRGSAGTPRPVTIAPQRNVAPPSDIIFLVGDSLTAADLVVSMAIAQAATTKLLMPLVKQKCPTLTQYSRVIMRLPVADNLRTALKINIM